MGAVAKNAGGPITEMNTDNNKRPGTEFDLEHSKNWSKKDWEVYTQHINDIVRKPDPYAEMDPETRKWFENRRFKLVTEKWFDILLAVGCTIWIISWDFLLLIPVLGIVGGLRRLAEIERKSLGSFD